MISRALIGVSDRTGIAELCRSLRDCGIELVATDGTRAALAAAGIDARAVSEVTGHPEMLDGRVKTLHPAIAAGILARRDLASHMQQLERSGYPLIDLVVVNLYPFAATLASGAPEAEVIDRIDIGGPTLIRAAAKNAGSVAVLVSPDQYQEALAEIRSGGGLSAATRRRLAARAFAHVAGYDCAIADHLAQRAADEELPSALTVGGPRLHTLRYGENPHQRGALYALPGGGGLAAARRIQGPELSYTNWLDADAARRLVSSFDRPAAAVIKHTNPCGFAVADTVAGAYRAAYDCDPRSAYGGIVAINRPLDEEGVESLGRTFLEALVVPGISDAAAALLASRARLRLLVAPSAAAGHYDIRCIDGGLLAQTPDRVPPGRDGMRVAGVHVPTNAQWEDLEVAWRVVPHVKSNAIVLVSRGAAVGVGAGQMSRVEAADLAVRRANDRAAGSVAASDAFFPMPDGLETLAAAGVTAVIHPGGSKRDDEVISAADSAGIALVAAGERHFRH